MSDIFGGVTDPAIQAGKNVSHGTCQGEGKPKLSVAPMRLADFSIIIPYGLMVGGHVTPIDHQYFEPTDRSLGRDSYPVYAMADATLAGIDTRPSGQHISPGVEHRLVFTISCKLFYYYDLVIGLTPDIQAAFDKDGQSVDIPVTAGQLIGYIGGQTLDFAVWDTDVRWPGLLVSEHSEFENWKIHTVDPLEYYTEELKAQLLPKHVRTAEPISGKIDYDVDGKLIGTWFLEGTNGYGGEGYWSGHLSIAPDHIDPTATIVSIGDWNGEAQQFGVAEGSADPSDVDQSSGLVKYQLVNTQYLQPDGEIWKYGLPVTGLRLVSGLEQRGCLLVQLEADRRLRVEPVPNQVCQTVDGFSPAARIYER